MPKPKPISNRQRKLQSKGLPRAGRKAAPVSVVRTATIAPEPKGLAARQAIVADIEARERMRLGDPDTCIVDSEPRSHLAGFIRLAGRDGLLALHRSGGLTDLQVKAGLAFRLCYEASAKGLCSGLGNAGEGGGGSRKTADLARSAADLHRAYVLARLNQMERAVGGVLVDGRELHALRMIAGEGRSLREVVGAGGRAAVAYRETLARGLDAIVRALRITEQ